MLNHHHKILSELYLTASRYYPIGFSLKNEQYAGYKDLTNMIEKKINSLINEKYLNNFLELKNEVSLNFDKCYLQDDSYKQSPCYSLSIFVMKRESLEVDTTYSLNLRVSLLSKFYTLFYEEASIHKSMGIRSNIFLPVKTSLISSMPFSEINHDSIETLNKIVNKHLPDYEHVQHYILFNTKIKGGIPYGVDESQESEYPIYAFIFDNEYRNMQGVYVLP